MLSKFFFRTAAAALIFAVCAVAASAQVMTITGKVTLKQADGTEVPVKDAVVDIFRVDISQKFNTKTNAKGVYTHAGIPITGIYTLAVSAPGARPSYAPDLRLSQRPENNFTLSSGDGSRLTLEDIKKTEAAGGAGANRPAAATGGGESKEDKAAREEMARKIAEVEAGNKKITESNEVVNRTFKAGNEALNANRYDEAINFYREGVAAREEPALMTNMSEALRRRGVNRFNAAIKATDNDAKTQGIEAAKKDWKEAAELAARALAATNAGGAGTDPTQQMNNAQNRMAAISTRALAMHLVATKVDQSQAPAALAAFQQYIEAEIDPAKKAKLKATAAQMLFDAGATDLAIAESRKMLADNPDDADANRIAGLALFATGDKGKYQEAANHLQRYVDKTPDTDPLKLSAKESLEYLRTAENVKPERTQPSRTGRRRP